MNTIYIPWTLTALRRVLGKSTISTSFRRETRMLLISRWLMKDGCTLKWDPQRRCLIVVPYYPTPENENGKRNQP